MSPAPTLNPASLKGVIKHTRFHSGVKFIDRSVNGHGIFEVRKCFHEELVGLGILQIVVCDPPGLALQFNKYGASVQTRLTFVSLRSKRNVSGSVESRR